MRDSREQKNYQDEWHKKSPSEARYWDRSVQLLAYQYAGKKYVLAPVHLLEPWAAIATSGSKAEKLKNIVFDNNNPLKHQVDHLRNVLKYKIGNVENVVLIGDFNIPSRFYGLTPSIYNFLTAGFKEVFSGNPNTFPAKSAGDRVHGIFKALSIKIDHTFIGNGIDRIEADVLHLKGSDHYPIYVVVAPKKAGFWSWF
jgi:endonuclease/exonuclease/phosphatase (EEP) superfamily protein YafD